MGRIAPAAANPDELADAYSVVPSRPDDTFKERTPNVDLVASGLFTLGVPYVVSVVAATGSTREGDQALYTPLVGPWLDLANREGCPGACKSETVYKTLLVADGLLQAAGALEIAIGFLFPLPHSVNTASLTRLRMVPNVARTGGGLTTVGVF
jgi:hypothetical protein